MYGRVVMGKTTPGAVDETQMGALMDEGLAHLRQCQGFVKIYQMLDRATGDSVQVHFWETEADLKAYLDSDFAKNYGQKARSIIEPHTVTPPVMLSMEVIKQS